MALDAIVRTWGYYLLILGTFLEGEIILVTAGFLASRGYLNIWIVILLGALGALISDLSFFYTGRVKGKKLIDKKPSLKKQVGLIHSYFKKNETPIMMGLRFTYGARTLTPMMIGTSDVKASKYVMINIFSSLIWALIYGLLGYFIGKGLTRIFGDLASIEWHIVLSIFIIGAALAMLAFSKNRRRR